MAEMNLTYISTRHQRTDVRQLTFKNVSTSPNTRTKLSLKTSTDGSIFSIGHETALITDLNLSGLDSS